MGRNHLGEDVPAWPVAIVVLLLACSVVVGARFSAHQASVAASVRGATETAPTQPDAVPITAPPPTVPPTTTLPVITLADEIATFEDTVSESFENDMAAWEAQAKAFASVEYTNWSLYASSVSELADLTTTVVTDMARAVTGKILTPYITDLRNSFGGIAMTLTAIASCGGTRQRCLPAISALEDAGTRAEDASDRFQRLLSSTPS